MANGNFFLLNLKKISTVNFFNDQKLGHIFGADYNLNLRLRIYESHIFTARITFIQFEFTFH